MPNRILALDLYGAHLTAVTVETSFRGYQIVGHHSEPRDPAKSLPEQLRAFFDRHPPSADTVLTALPAEGVAYRVFTVPFRDRRRIAQTVPFEIETQVPFALEEAIVDFQVLSRDEHGTRIFAALAPRKVLEEHLQAVAEVGLDPAIVDFAPLTTLNVLSLFEGDRPERFAFLHLDGGHATVGIYRGGGLEGLRALFFAADTPVATLVSQLCWSLRSLDGSVSVAAVEGGEDLPLLLGGSVPEGLSEQLRDEMRVAVQRLEDLPLKHVPPDLRREQGLLATALGLALREVIDAPTLGVNFRRDEFAYHRGQQELRATLGRLGALAGAVALLFFVAEGATYWQLSRRHQDLRAAVRKIFTETLPGRTPLDEVTQLTQEIDALRERQRKLGFSEAGPISLLDMLREISLRAPAEPRMNVDTLGVDGDTIRLRAKTTSFEAVESIKKSLAESALFRAVQVKDPRTAPDGSVEFGLNVSFGKGETEAPAP